MILAAIPNVTSPFVGETESSSYRQDKEKHDGKTLIKEIGNREDAFTKENSQSCLFVKKMQIHIPSSIF